MRRNRWLLLPSMVLVLSAVTCTMGSFNVNISPAVTPNASQATSTAGVISADASAIPPIAVPTSTALVPIVVPPASTTSAGGPASNPPTATDTPVNTAAPGININININADTATATSTNTSVQPTATATTKPSLQLGATLILGRVTPGISLVTPGGLQFVKTPTPTATKKSSIQLIGTRALLVGTPVIKPVATYMLQLPAQPIVKP
jgi:hypothetical protein